MNIEEMAERTSDLVTALASVWERSVRATHDFLTEGDIAGMRPEVAAGLAAIEHLAVTWSDGTPVAFAGAQGGKLEMLFCAPEVRGRGVGHTLLAHVVETWDVHRLDVNEQNPQAVGFYEHEGFAVVARSSADGAGRPFVLLHMMRAEGIRAQMASGSWFEAADSILARDRAHARSIMRRFNADLPLDDGARKDLLRDLFGALGAGAGVAAGAQVDYGYNLFVGKNSYFNFGCTFLDGAPIVFGDDVWVGPGCTFATPLHPLVGRERAFFTDADGVQHLRERNLPITVERAVWIAANVTVNPGVTIGEGAVIGSGSVVTKDIPPRTLAFGNPCRVVREITDADCVFGA